MSDTKAVEQRKVATASLFTHRYPEETTDAVHRAIDAATEHGVQLLFSSEESEKHSLAGMTAESVKVGVDDGPAPDVCIVLGGDGTILYGLRRYAGRRVPVFGINFGWIGFLAAVERAELDAGLERALGGRFETLPLPALTVEVGSESFHAVNDVAFHRKPELRVAQLTYSLGNERIGAVRCDGLVVATPVGSTGYNLANGGPILAWGVEGYVISFVAPHTLTARPLLAAAPDVMVVENESTREAVAVSIDGRGACELPPGGEAYVRYSGDVALLAQLEGTNFYHRFREKFGKQ